MNRKRLLVTLGAIAAIALPAAGAVPEAEAAAPTPYLPCQQYPSTVDCANATQAGANAQAESVLGTAAHDANAEENGPVRDHSSVCAGGEDCWNAVSTVEGASSNLPSEGVTLGCNGLTGYVTTCPYTH